MIQEYMQDVARELKQNALEISNLRATASAADKVFLDGKLLAYNEVLSLLIGQARAFGIDVEILGLAGFDPDRDL